MHSSLGYLIDRWVKILATGSIALVLLAAVANVAEILIRWIFGFSLIGIAEITAAATILAVCGCFPYCLWVQGNIVVKVFAHVKSKNFQRILETIAGFLLLSVFLIMAQQLWMHGQQLHTANNVSLMLRIPMGIIWMIASILVLFAALTQLYVVASNFRGTSIPDSSSTGTQES